MKRKFKQWWSAIVPISAKQAITSHLNWTHLIKRTTTFDIGLVGWLVGWCLAPPLAILRLYRGVNNITAISWREQYYGYIVAWTILRLYRGVNNITAISWREQYYGYIVAWTILRLYRGVNNITAISWREQYYGYIVAWTILRLYRGVNNVMRRLWRWKSRSWCIYLTNTMNTMCPLWSLDNEMFMMLVSEELFTVMIEYNQEWWSAISPIPIQ